MIRLSHAGISKAFEFDENVINSLVVENPDFFRALTEELVIQAESEVGGFTLSEDFTPIKFSKNVEIISQIIPFDSNKKTLIGKICGALEKRAFEEDFYEPTHRMLADIEKYMLDISIDFPGDICFENICVQSLIKSTGVKIDDRDLSLPERILNYMKLVREFEGDKLFVFVNTRCFFSDDVMSGFTGDVLRNKFKILLLDPMEREMLPGESRWIIDEDLCEIQLLP